MPRSVRALAEGRPVSRPAVSQHFRILKDAHLVQVEREGTRRVYSLQIEVLVELRAYLEEFWSDALASFK